MFSSDSRPSWPANSPSSHNPGLTAPRSSKGSTIAQPSDSSTTEEDHEVSHRRVRTRPDLGGKDTAMGFPDKDTAMVFPGKPTEVFNGTREPRTEWGGRKEEGEGTPVIGFNSRLTSSLVPFLWPYNCVFRSSIDNRFLSVLANEELVMAKHSGSIMEQAQCLFQVQRYQQMTSDIVLSILHNSSQSYLGVSEHTVKLFGRNDQAASVPETCLFKDIDRSKTRMPLVPILYPDFSVSYKDKEVVLVDKTDVAAFSIVCCADNLKQIGHLLQQDFIQ